MPRHGTSCGLASTGPAQPVASTICFSGPLSRDIWQPRDPTVEGRGTESEMAIEAVGAEPQLTRRLGLASVAALGVVFGDIGTSPLYTLKTVLDYTGPNPDAKATL